MPKSVESFIKYKKLRENPLPKTDQIRWNCETANMGEMDFDNQKVKYNFFIIYRNPNLILEKILDNFQMDFHPSMEEDLKIEGKIEKSVNSYILISYLANRVVSNLDFGFTKIPVIKDKNLTNRYKKKGSLEDYIQKFI